jgi:hypothetical protein
MIAPSTFQDIFDSLCFCGRRLDEFPLAGFFLLNTDILNLFNLGNQDVELEARHHLDGNSGLRLNSQEGAVLLRIRG